MWTIEAMQRGYAYIMLALRDLTGSQSSKSWSEWTEWKATCAMVMAQGLLVVDALYAISVVTGRMLAVIRERHTLIGFAIVLSVTLYVVNEQAQRRLLPRFQQGYVRLKRWVRFSIATGMVLATVLLLMCGKELATVAHGLG
jgi:hypothetical protein